MMSRWLITTIAAAGALATIPQSSEAGGCGGYGGYSYSYGGGYGSYYTAKYTPVYHRPVVVHKPIVVHKPVVVHEYVAPHCCHPHHCHVWVQPGESLDAICLREYGDASLWRRVAQYNRCHSLVVGQKLLLPSIYDDGRMIPSTAPAPAVPAAPPVAVLDAPPVAPGA